jgi:hypothetical protein
MLTWTDIQTKMQRLTKDSNADVLVQLSQDWNTGYHIFNQKLGRYYARRQKFANSVVGQGLYQTPTDSVRIVAMSYLVANNYEPALIQIRSEEEWRNIVSLKNIKTNWPAYYFEQGPDLVSIWPLPSQNGTNNIRYIYQPQDHDLSIQDVTNTSNLTGSTVTVTVTNGSPTVTADASATPFTVDMATLMLQITGQTDLTFYDIVSATSTTLTLKSAYVGTSGSGKAWRIGQTPIVPQEYQDAPMHYALGNYYASNSNVPRSAFHLGFPEKPGMFWTMIDQCKEDYSSSSQSNVIMDDENESFSPWFITPPAAS